MEVVIFLIDKSKWNWDLVKNYTENLSIQETSKGNRIPRGKKIENLKKSYRNEELVFVLGSGVSVPFNLPSWDNLLQKLLIESFSTDSTENDVPLVLSKIFPQLFPSSPLISARIIEEDFKKQNSSKSFKEIIRDALYSQINREADSSTIKELLQFCIAPGKSPNLDSIITYNYDDVLETVLNSSDVEIPYKSIYKLGMNPKNGELPIYHVHGYLPQYADKENTDSFITLSENLYHKQYNDIYSWNNIVQINKFTGKTCVLIGISLNDPNIRRLLDIAKLQRGQDSNQQHYMFKKRYKLEYVKRKLELIIRNDSSLRLEKAIANLELNETAKTLLKKMEEFEELDANSFGIQIIWLQDHDEIADVLKKVREE
ncbi:hypothetical protein LD39_05195 [Halobacillus sp. BBL2006]|nr:hypothetical protein LD39_05195 [Halobacillus sp. BBL2006]